MEIVLDVDMDGKGNIMARHVIQTSRNATANVGVAGVGAGVMTQGAFLLRLHASPNNIPGTGWDRVTNLPQYAGKTLWQVFLAEIVRLNDVPTRALLGV